MKKRKLTLTICSVTAAAILAGCGGSAASDGSYNAKSEAAPVAAAEEAAVDFSDDLYDYDYEAAEADVEEPTEAAGSSGGESVSDSEIMRSSNRKLIKTVNMSAETREFDKFIDNIKDRIESLGGYAESTNVSGNSYDSYSERYANIVARIPADKLDSFVTGVEKASNITNKNESVEDVTLQYADVEAHKESLKIEQTRLNELLEQADTLENIIELENRLTEVRYEIESYESRLRMMSNQVQYSTVYLDVREVKEYSPDPVEEKSFGQRLAEEFLDSCENAWETIQDFVIGFIAFLPTLLVILIILFVVFIIVFGIVKAIIALVKKLNKKSSSKRVATVNTAVKDTAQNTAANTQTDTSGEKK